MTVVENAQMVGISRQDRAVDRRHLTGRSDVPAGRDHSRRGRRHGNSGDIKVIEAMLYVGTVLAVVPLAGLAISAVAAGAVECTNTNSTTTVCQNPGNTQVSTTPGVTAQSFPYWWWGWPWGSGITISIGGGGAHPHH